MRETAVSGVTRGAAWRIYFRALFLLDAGWFRVFGHGVLSAGRNLLPSGSRCVGCQCPGWYLEMTLLQ